MGFPRLAALVPVAAAVLTFAAWPAASQADGLACSVPSNMTYDTVVYENNGYCGAGWRFTFDLITPATGVWGCSVPDGFHSTAVDKTDDCSGHPDVMAKIYLLAAN
jgi:hypothetical protein